MTTRFANPLLASILLCAAAAPARAEAAAHRSAAAFASTDSSAVGQDITVPRGERYDHDIEVVRGTVKVLGEVKGDVKVVNGRLEIEGKVDGDVSVVWGSLRLTGTVTGDVAAILAEVEMADGAKVGGEFTTVMSNVDRSGKVEIRGRQVGVGGPVHRSALVWPWFFFNLIRSLLGIFLVAVFAALFPRRLERMAAWLAARPERWVLAPLTGLGTVVGAFFVCLGLVLSIVGVLLVPFFSIGVWLTSVFGTAGLALLVGRRLLGSEGVLGPAVLAYLALSVLTLVPCLGVLVCILLAWYGLGLAALTAYGSEGGWKGIQAARAARRAAGPPPVPAGGTKPTEDQASEGEEDQP